MKNEEDKNIQECKHAFSFLNIYLTLEEIAIVEGKMKPTGQNYLEKVKGYMIRL